MRAVKMKKATTSDGKRGGKGRGKTSGKTPTETAPPVAKVANLASEPISAAGDERAEHDPLAAQKFVVLALQEIERTADPRSSANAIRHLKAALAALGRDDRGSGRITLSAERLHRLSTELVARRKAAGMSQDDLARLAGLSKRTVYNLEHERQAPSQATLLALVGVAALRLPISAFADGDLSADPEWTPNSWFAPRYNPAALMRDLVDVLNGPGGQIEQTYLYLEPASANDYLALCSSAPVFVSFRNAAPLERAAEIIARRSAGQSLDVVGLGSGDGRSEVRLVQALQQLSGTADQRLYLLDISHTLLSVAHKHAAEQLEPACKVFALHANFHDLAGYPVLHARAAPRRRRIYTLLGGTMANLDNEIRFFKDLAACSAADDLCVIDVQLPHAPADQPDKIRAKDPPLAAGYRPPHQRWLAGPIERHCADVAEVSIGVELESHTLVPGSYALSFVATARLRDGIQRRFQLVRFRRYDLAALSTCLQGLGWQTLETLRYGLGAEKNSAVLVLRRG